MHIAMCCKSKSLLEGCGEEQPAACASAAGPLKDVTGSELQAQCFCFCHAADSHKWCMCRYVSAMGNHVVNPVITPSAVSGTPSGIMAAALVGPDYKYTAVWTPINMQLGGSSRP